MNQTNELPMRDLPALIEAIFEGAKRQNEVEYCRALLRERCDTVDPLLEARRYIHQYITLLEAPIEESLKLRLMLSLYCHSIEVNDLYAMTGNMLRITAGSPYLPEPFPAKAGTTALSVEEKAGLIAEWATKADLEEFGDLLSEMILPEVRSAFAQSVYSLDESKFYYRPQAAQDREKCVLSLEWILPRLNRGVAVALTFIDTTQRHLQSYQANQVLALKTPNGAQTHVELIARAGLGLIGLREVMDANVPDQGADKPAIVEPSGV